jgi:hypothetical protein
MAMPVAGAYWSTQQGMNNPTVGLFANMLSLFNAEKICAKIQNFYGL